MNFFSCCFCFVLNFVSQYFRFGKKICMFMLPLETRIGTCNKIVRNSDVYILFIYLFFYNVLLHSHYSLIGQWPLSFLIVIKVLSEAYCVLAIAHTFHMRKKG